MKGIVILAHGSRRKSTEETLKKIVLRLKEKLGDIVLEMAFLQFSDKNLKSGLDSLVGQGVNDIKVIPYFLFDGIHITDDIPNEINEYMENNKGIKIVMGKTLGFDERLVDILVDRVNE